MRYPLVLLFSAFSFGLWLGKIILVPWFILASGTAIFFLIVLFIFLRALPLIHVGLVVLFTFIGFLHMRVDELGKLEGKKEILGVERQFFFRITSLPRENELFTVYRAVLTGVMQGKRRLFLSQAVQVRDYTKGPKEYFAEYRCQGLAREVFYDTAKGIFVLWIQKDHFPQKIKDPPWWRAGPFFVSQTLRNFFIRHLTPEAAAFSSLFLLGTEESGNISIKSIFIEAGTIHILAVSGLHVGMVYLITSVLLKALGIRKRWKYCISALVIVGYAFLCGLHPPVARSACMFLLFTLSKFFQRKSNALCALVLSGFILLCLNPQDAFAVSFQLSFLGALSLILGFQYFYFRRLLSSPWESLRKLFFGSLYAEIMLAPLLGYYFSTIYPLALFSNILVVPVSFLILVFIFIFIGFGYFYPFSFLGEGLSWSINMFIFLNSLCAHGKVARISFQWNIWGVILWFFFLGFFLWVRARAENNRIDFDRAQ